MQWVSWRAVAGAVVLGGILTAGALVSPSTVFGSVEALVANPVPFGLAVLGIYLVRPLLAWPTTPLAVLVGYGFGFAPGVPIALAFVVLTVTPVFVVARRIVGPGGGDDACEPGERGDPCEPGESTPDEPRSSGQWAARGLPVGAALERAGDRVVRYYETTGPIRGVTISRLAPIPSDVATCAAARGGVGYRAFVIGTVLGETPWTIAAVLVGSSAATISTGGLGDLGVGLTVACTLAALCLLAGPVHRAASTRSSLE